uniref:Protein kinase domain-containing protein n=1 Tax=Cyprinus carpio TaxID=7962 RepID=A0A8C1WMI3_CYPCA
MTERYKVGRMIGDGNFAVVRECVERSTGRAYALKIINKSKCRGKVRPLECFSIKYCSITLYGLCPF